MTHKSTLDVCPGCSGKAVFRPFGTGSEMEIVCTVCGLSLREGSSNSHRLMKWNGYMRQNNTNPFEELKSDVILQEKRKEEIHTKFYDQVAISAISGLCHHLNSGNSWAYEGVVKPAFAIAEEYCKQRSKRSLKRYGNP